MKQNITLSLDKELIIKGRILAAKKETSLSRLLSDILKKIIEEEEGYEACRRKALANLERGFRLGGKIACSREELHER
jgi:hypothetical protein